MGVSFNITGLFLFGVLLDWLACGINSLGNALFRYDALKNQGISNENHFYRYLGFFSFVTGGLVDVASLGFIPLSIWASNTAVAIPLSAFVAYFLLGEVMKPCHYLSMILIVIGSVGAVFTGHHDQGNEAAVLFVESWQKPFPLILVCVIISIQLVCGYLTYVHKKKLKLFHDMRQTPPPAIEPSLKNVKPMEHQEEEQEVGEDIKIIQSKTHESTNLFGSAFSNLENPVYKIGQVVPSSLLPAIQTCWTNLFMKCFIEGATEIFTNKEDGNDMETKITVTIVCSCVLCFSLPLQLVFIQWMMQCHECVIAIPVYQCQMIIITSIFGIIFFHEIPVSIIGFLISTLIACSGIMINTFMPEVIHTEKSMVFQKNMESHHDHVLQNTYDIQHKTDIFVRENHEDPEMINKSLIN